MNAARRVVCREGSTNADGRLGPFLGWTRRSGSWRGAWLLALVGAVAGSFVAGPAGGAGREGKRPPDRAATPATPGPDHAGDLSLIEAARQERWTGDLDGMITRRRIRVLVAYSKMFFFVDRGRLRGITAEALQEFETVLNRTLKTGHRTVRVLFVPVSRDELIAGLVEGRGDLAVANLTIAPARRARVDFSDPVYRGVRELVVSGPGAPRLAAVEDLAGQEVYVRRSSSYDESLRGLNKRLRARGQPAVRIRAADENLEDEDLLEMVQAGLVPLTVVDSHKAEFWAEVFDEIRVHPELAVRTEGEIAWAFRQGSPKLKAAVNEFVRTHRAGTLFGNILLKRYLRSTKWVKSATSTAELRKFRAMVELFRTYGARYDFDWLMVAAQGYQESQLDQSRRSRAGAVGVMQIKPTTAAAPPIGIPDVHRLESNIHAGVKYLRHIADRYFGDEALDPVNRQLLTFAAYNAGPARVAGLRRKAAQQGLDPNRWFRHVEVVAAREIGRETVQYVSNIYKYYLAYRLVVERMREREAARDAEPMDPDQ